MEAIKDLAKNSEQQEHVETLGQVITTFRLNV